MKKPILYTWKLTLVGALSSMAMFGLAAAIDNTLLARISGWALILSLTALPLVRLIGGARWTALDGASKGVAFDPEATKRKIGSVLLGVFALLIFLGYRSCNAPPTPEEIAKKKAEAEQAAERDCTNGSFARTAAINAVEKVLKAPSSAEFAPRSEITTNYLGECKHQVRGYVDAQNSFGAKIRTKFDVVVSFDKLHDRWVTSDLEMK